MGPGGVEEQEWVRGGGEGTWADRGFSVLLSHPCENHDGKIQMARIGPCL